MGTPYAEVIGDPVAHSKSPQIHRHWLQLLGIHADYRARRVGKAKLVNYFERRREDPDWLGCNVTVPHKQAALPVVDSMSDETMQVGAVNCIAWKSGCLTGYNSDVAGVAAVLDGVELKQQKVAIVGAGGAARAALVYLAAREVGRIVVLARDPRKAELLNEIIPRETITVGSFDEASALLDGASLIINASPLGMTGCPMMPVGLLAAVKAHPHAALFDMVYDPLETAFLATGLGLRLDGLTMLVGQAAAAFELFFGVPAPPRDRQLREVLVGSVAEGN